LAVKQLVIFEMLQDGIMWIFDLFIYRLSRSGDAWQQQWQQYSAIYFQILP